MTIMFASKKAGVGAVVSVVAGTGIAVDDTDPANPVVSVDPTDSGWIDLSTLTYENSWSDGPNPAQFRIIDNLVYLRGQIANGGNGDVVTTNPLPVDARAPIQIKVVCCPDGYAGNAPSVSISTAGVLTAFWTGGSGMTLTGVYVTD
jgi:hypothetical protein